MTTSAADNPRDPLTGGLSSHALRSAFGFVDDDDAWLNQARAATAPEMPGVLGSFAIIEEIGRGSQGAVFKAVQPGTKRTIAVKRLAAGSLAGSSARERLDREIRTLCSLSHPGIVTAFGADTIDGQAVLLMEWIDGVPIDRWAADNEHARSVRDRLELFAKICDAVSHAHQRGILHRDLKPSNILVDREDRPRVLDFGLAKLIHDAPDHASVSQTSEGFLGTPSYAAPEQVDTSRGPVDTRSDVYALGVILYQLLTGAFPVAPTSDLSATLRAVIHDLPLRPSVRSHALDGEIDAIVLKALAKEPENRYQSVDALADDVRRHLAGRTVLAHPPSTLYEMRKLVSRHRLAVLVAVAGIIGVGTLAMISSVLALRLSSALSAAVTSQRHAEQEAARSEANAEFLIRMFDSLGEAVAAGDLRPERSMLAEARARLQSGDLTSHPILEVSLWRRLAYTCVRLGLPIDAESSSARAVEFAKERLGPDDEEMGHCLLVAGLVAEGRHDYARAESQYRESERIFRHVLGPEHLNTAQALNNLGCALKDLGRFDEARACFESALAVRVQVYGPMDRHIASTYRNLGTLARAERKFDEAERFYSMALEIVSQNGSQTDSVVAGILHHLGTLAVQRKDLVTAERYFRRAVTIHRENYGVETAIQINSLRSLATTLDRLNRREEAVTMAKDVLELCQRNFQPDHPDLAAAHTALGICLMHAGRAKDAEPLLMRGVELCTSCQPFSKARLDLAQRSLTQCQGQLTK